jgi:SAM-dependent methyltransferase
MDMRHYEEQTGTQYWSTPDRAQAIAKCFEDTERRAGYLRPIVAGKRWLDVGTGAGAILDAVGSLAAEAQAVEPQQGIRDELRSCGHTVMLSVEDAADAHFDLITLFHVFEHLTDPLASLRTIRQKLRPGGRLIIEVPHARDFLIAFLGLDEFKAFTFWSEHLLLHTRQSLTIMLKAGGFENICIQGCQRYPLANHLHWLARKRPGGHQIWSELRTPRLDEAYAEMLSGIDMTDTLVAYAEA